MPDKPPTEPKDKPQFSKPSADASPPPKREKPAGSGRPSSAGRKPLLKTEIQQFYGVIAVGVSVASPEDGALVMQYAEPCADAWYRLAQQNASVRETWELILKGSAWSGVVMVHATMLYGIARNHDLLPELINPLGENKDDGNGSGNTPPRMG